VNARLLLPAVRDLYSRLPETYHLQPWEMQWMLFALGYVDGLIPEKEIAAAIEVARRDGPQWGQAKPA
jgi:hypothetical protein